MSTIFGDFVNGLCYFCPQQNFIVDIYNACEKILKGLVQLVVCVPIHKGIIVSSKGTTMALYYARYFHGVRWSEPGMENTPGCEWAAD